MSERYGWIASVAAIGLCGCSLAYDFTTVSRFKAPDQVRLLNRLDSGGEKAALEAGATEPATVVVTSGGQVVAARTLDGGLELSMGDDHRVLIDASGETTLGTPVIKGDEYRLASEVTFSGEVALGGAGGPQHKYTKLSPVLVTPVANVDRVFRIKTPARRMRWLLFPGSMLAVVGVVLLATDSTNAGALFTLTGLGVDAAGVYFMVAHPTEIPVYPPKERSRL